MPRIPIVFCALCLATSTLAGAAVKPVETVTWNGWFSDEGCAAAKLKAEEVTPNGTDCVKKCLAEGAVAVFVNPKTRSMYRVVDHPSVNDDVGYYLELTGIVDEQTKTISVRSVKRMGDVIQMCGRRPKKG
jgi:hypothetical protein